MPIIDGQHQLPGASSSARVLEAEAGEKASILKLDLTSAYGYGPLEKLTRSFNWETADVLPTLTLTDEFQFAEAPPALIERFVTFCQPVLEEGKVLLQGTGGNELHILYNANVLTPEISAHVFSNHFAEAKTWYGLDFHASGKPDSQETYEFKFQFIDSLPAQK
ncbi:hypothetical protein D3C75_886100 [compost metagenome]